MNRESQCSECSHEKVCSIKKEYSEYLAQIHKITVESGAEVTVDINCKYYDKKIINTRNSGSC